MSRYHAIIIVSNPGTGGVLFKEKDTIVTNKKKYSLLKVVLDE